MAGLLLLKANSRSVGWKTLLDSTLNAIQKSKQSVCRGAINQRYVREHMKPRVKNLWVFADSASAAKKGGQAGRLAVASRDIYGFVMGFPSSMHVHCDTPTVCKNREKIFYIDLICSVPTHRLGKALMGLAEEHARKTGCKTVALRAANPDLVPYYNRLGYSRTPVCTRQSRRSERLAMRQLDAHAHERYYDKDTKRKAIEYIDGLWMSKCV